MAAITGGCYSALDQVNRDNVQKLAPAWVFQTGDYENGLQATPIVVDGVLYLSTSNAWAFALDGATGKPLWEYHFPLSKSIPLYGKQNRGVAVGQGLVFLGTADNHMVALDQPHLAKRSGASTSKIRGNVDATSPPHPW